MLFFFSVLGFCTYQFTYGIFTGVACPKPILALIELISVTQEVIGSGVDYFSNIFEIVTRSEIGL